MKWLADVIGFLGIGLIGFGVAQIHWPTAFIVVGIIFFCMALAASWAKARSAQERTKE